MNIFNLYLCGVGGQGIGLLAEVIIQAVELKNIPVIGADTHGLAQRGGTVRSHIRIGSKAKTPLISQGQADAIIGLERLEALRGIREMLQKEGTALYYDAVYQPVHVRSFNAKYPEESELQDAIEMKSGKLHRVCLDSLPDERMQNVALLAMTGKIELIPGIDNKHIRAALDLTLPTHLKAKNLEFYDSIVQTSG